MSYILKYIAEGEHQQQDFKMRIDDSKKIAKTLRLLQIPMVVAF